MDKNQRHPLSQITKMKFATFVNKGSVDHSCFVNNGFIHGSYIVETRHGKALQQKTCHFLGLSEIAQIRRQTKICLISNTVWSAIVGNPDAISTRIRQVTLSRHGANISPSSELGQEREERAERGFNGGLKVHRADSSRRRSGVPTCGREARSAARACHTINELQAVLPPKRWRGAETERGSGLMRGCTGRDQIWCPSPNQVKSGVAYLSTDSTLELSNPRQDASISTRHGNLS